MSLLRGAVCADWRALWMSQSAMAEGSSDWLAAACCHDAHDTERVHGHLPRAYRAELVRLGLVAAASSAFFIAAPLLLAPLPSRTLTGAVPLAHSGITASPLMALSASTSTSPLPPRRDLRRPRATLTAARVEPARFLTSGPSPERRRNVFSRFFRSFVRRPAPPVVSVKADATY